MKQRTIDALRIERENHRKHLRRFRPAPGRGKAVLYGSRAKGNFKPGSDIDLTLFGEGPTSTQLGEIDEELDELLLPYQIDLSIFDQIENVKLHEHIERVGVVFYQLGQWGADIYERESPFCWLDLGPRGILHAPRQPKE